MRVPERLEVACISTHCVFVVLVLFVCCCCFIRCDSSQPLLLQDTTASSMLDYLSVALGFINTLISDSMRRHVPIQLACGLGGVGTNGTTIADVRDSRRAGKASLSDVLLPYGWPQGAPPTALASLAISTLTAGRTPALTSSLLSLANLEPLAMLDMEQLPAAVTPFTIQPSASSGTTGSAGPPPPFSMRWILIAGSLLQLPHAASPAASPFWQALWACTCTPACTAEGLDLWGERRKPRMEHLSADATGRQRAAWLAAAILSGLVPREQQMMASLLGASLVEARASARPVLPAAALGGGIAAEAERATLMDASLVFADAERTAATILPAVLVSAPRAQVCDSGALCTSCLCVMIAKSSSSRDLPSKYKNFVQDCT